MLYIELQPPCVAQIKTYFGRHKQPYNFYVILYMGQTPHSLAKLPVAHSTSILSQKVWTTDWNYLVATDQLLYFKSLFIERVMQLLSHSTTCLCTLNGTFAQVTAHSSIFTL
jgi:hypothetical protein